MSIHASASRHASSLEFVRALVRVISTEKQHLTPELQAYLFDVTHNAALFLRDRGSVNNPRPEVVEMAFEIADEADLVLELSQMSSPNCFNAVVAKRLLQGFQRFAAA